MWTLFFFSAVANVLGGGGGDVAGYFLVVLIDYGCHIFHTAVADLTVVLVEEVELVFFGEGILNNVMKGFADVSLDVFDVWRVYQVIFLHG